MTDWLADAQLHADIMERCFASVDAGKLPSDEDLLMFHHKGARLLSCATKNGINYWNGLDAHLVIDLTCFYPIRGIKDCLIISNKDDDVLRKKPRKDKTILHSKQGTDTGKTTDIPARRKGNKETTREG
jgi:hypothetical protein